jgi:hypothetical protein
MSSALTDAKGRPINTVSLGQNGLLTVMLVDSNGNPVSVGGGGGGGGSTTFVYSQDIPADTWTVAHNLGKYPSVTVVDTANNVGIPDVQYIDNNNIVITLGSSFSGKAYLN